MSRLLRASLHAYPRHLRERDGAELLALAEELAAEHGVAREAVGLVRGGWAERRRGPGRRRRARLALVAAGVSATAVVTWSAAAAAGPGRVEVERYGCGGDCGTVEREVADRVDAGWSCTELAGPAPVSWRCTLD